MEHTLAQPESGCQVCGRYALSERNTKARELRRVDGRWVCRHCAMKPEMVQAGYIREDKLLNLIENWYG